MLKSVSVRLVGLVAIGAAALGFSFSGAGGVQALASGAHNTVPVRIAAPGRSGGIDAPFTLVSRNANVTNRSGAQSETAIAVDPTSPKHLLASLNDLTDTARVYESFNGGKTWALSTLNLDPDFCYDTWLQFNSAGDAFLSYECFDERIAYLKHGTTTWVKTKLTGAGSFPDRDMVTVDNTATSPFAGSVYVGYDDNGANNAAHLMISRTGFGSWVQSPKFNDGNPTIGVNAAVGPDGTVYGTWEDYSGKKLWTDKSTNGGSTWGTDHVVTNFRINTTTFFISIPPQPDRGVLPMPMTATAPAGTSHAGRLYVTYFDKAVATSNTNIYFRYSDNGGSTWSAEKQINDDTNNAWHFHPAISVSPNGTIGVSFYDTRNDPTGKKTDQFFTFSTDGGLTWAPNVKVTSAQSDESGSGDPNDYGDYQNIAASVANWFAPVWTDSRRPGAQAEDTFMARVKP
ncbi:MAG TPA: sialidase family protein [Actinomycetota bacterium]